MREALSALTGRGQAFVAAGIALVAAAIVLGQDTLGRAGVLVGVLPLLAAWWLSRSHHDLTLQRGISPPQVPAGQQATVTLGLTNTGRRTVPGVRLEEGLPYVLGTRARFVLDPLAQGEVLNLDYTVRSDVRGRFEVGPATLRVSDPFGLVELGLGFATTTHLTVTPRTVPLPPIPLGGTWSGAGDNRPRAFATGSAEDVTVREYRRGDDLRRVHWRSSARTGELMVRREEQPWQSRATVFLDNRASAHRGQGAASSLEVAVSAAASVAVHLTDLGWNVRLVTAAGESHETEWHTHTARASSAPLLENLALLRPVRLGTPDTRWLSDGGSGGLTIGVFGALHSTDLPFLRRLRHRAANAAALDLDVARWAPQRGATPDRGAEMLRAAGWRCSTIAPGDRLTAAWQRLAHSTTPSSGGVSS